MASYFEWNEAIAKFFTEGMLPGDVFYLSVDDDALIEIGAGSFAEGRLSSAVRDFESAVRNECVTNGRVVLPTATLEQADDTPPYVAFLGAMVLAAHRMAPEDDIAEINYFTRLREILDLGGERGRPSGLKPPGAPEEGLWVAFNSWILSKEWQPSAERGPEGPTKFTNYPLSQSLLREGDKGKLEEDFRNAEDGLGRDSDRERVGAWFFNRATGFSTSHIRSLAQEATTDRYDAIVDAVYGVYTMIGWNQPSTGDGTSARWRSPRRLTAGLYREFDPLFGTIDYHLFPRRQARELGVDLAVIHDGRPEPLHQEKDGQFRPLWQVHPAGGKTYQISGDSRIEELHLPARSFWVLVRDRFDSASGTFASRGAPRLGETFLLLCRKECEEQLNILKDEGLLNWDGDPVEALDYDEWFEYRECMVLSANWDGIIPQMHELFHELRPRGRASISLKGGLTTGRRDSWLEGHLPELSITSFDPNWQIRVTNISQPDSEPALDEMVTANTSVDLSHLAAGDYSVQVLKNDRSVDRRYMRVLSWDSLEPSNPTETFGTPIGDYILRGSVLNNGNFSGQGGG